MQEFKIRCSAISKIMGGSIGLTEKQKEEYDKFYAKDKLTDLQQEKFVKLHEKHTNPQLPQGAKTYVETWFKEQLYARRKTFSGKYTDKGLLTENDSLDFVARHLDYGMLIKNEERKYGEFIEGECDNVQPDHIIDVKSSWDCFTLPLLDDDLDPDYYWQGQGYMSLWDKKKYKLIYVLNDTPEEIIDREVSSYCWKNSVELTEELYNQFHNDMTYQDIPDEFKIKVYDFERNDDDIDQIKIRVKMCREYLNELKGRFNIK